MLDNPDISIEIGGHTNGFCDDEFCNLLSKQRAESVMNYLIQHGVEAYRIEAVGYGKSRPIASNDTRRSAPSTKGWRSPSAKLC